MSNRVLSWLLLPVTIIVIAGCGTSNTGATKSTEKRPAEPVTLRISSHSSIERLLPNQAINAQQNPEIMMETARGEIEGAQLKVEVSSGNPRLTVKATDLVSKQDKEVISAGNIRSYFAQSMTVERGSPAGRRGVYIDPLIPTVDRSVNLKPGQQKIVWVDVETPLGTKPGVYRGSLQLWRAEQDGSVNADTTEPLSTIPLTVKVRNVTLPDRPALGSSIGFDASQMVRFEGVKPGSDELRDVTDNYAKLLAKSRLSIADVGALPPHALPGHVGLPDDALYLKNLFNRRGVSSVRIPFYMDYPFADPLGNDRPQAVLYLREAAKWVKRNGWTDRAYIYAIDEPGRERAGEVRELKQLLRDADPKLKLLLTREASAKEFKGQVDIWVPNINPKRFRAVDVKQEQKAKRDTWWYPSITTWQPYPTLFIDDLRSSPRAYGWLAWRYDVKGFLYWSATHWHDVEDPYKDPATYRETESVGNGDGVLVYPGGLVGRAGEPIPSVRLMMLRDGVEDHDLLTMASCVGNKAQKRQLANQVKLITPSMSVNNVSLQRVTALRSKAFGILESAAKRRAYDPDSRKSIC